METDEKTKPDAPNPTTRHWAAKARDFLNNLADDMPSGIAAELRKIAASYEAVMEAYPPPGLEDKALRLIRDEVAKLLKSTEWDGDVDTAPHRLLPHEWSLISTYLILERTQRAGTQSLIGGLLGGFAPSLFSTMMKKGAKMAEEYPDPEDAP